MVVQCCVCQKVRQENEWVPSIQHAAEREPVSHGYCPRCAAAAFEEIRLIRATRKPSRVLVA